MKTAAQALAKWEASTSLGEQAWVDGLQTSQKPIVDAAINARNAAISGYSAALQPGGIWESKLRATGDAAIKAAAVAKRTNYSTGIQQGTAKMGAALQKIIAYEQNGLAGLAAVSGGKARMNYWFDYMSAGRGQLGA